MPSFLPFLSRRRRSGRASSDRYDTNNTNPRPHPLPPPYAIDYSQSGSDGERIARKRHAVTWRFLFPPGDGDHDGGVAGEEHEITLHWDWIARRRSIAADGIVVDRDVSRSTLCDHSWTMAGADGGRKVRVLAHAFAKNDVVGFRQYDLFVDGISFFDFPKVKGGTKGPNDAAVGADELLSSGLCGSSRRSGSAAAKGTPQNAHAIHDVMEAPRHPDEGRGSNIGEGSGNSAAIATRMPQQPQTSAFC